MTPFAIGYVGSAILLVLLALRIPIGVALLAVSFGGVWAAFGLPVAVGLARAVPFEFMANWEFSAVPMFLLMGYIAAHGGLTDGMFNALAIILRRVPGGLACAGITGCALFSAASGSSVATAAAMAKISVPIMLKQGYDKALATGTIAAGGTLGNLIPPGILLIVYAIAADVPLGPLFIAGFIPGALSALMYIALILIRVKLNPSLAPRSDIKATRQQKINALKQVWPLPTLITGVLGGIFLGIMTPTEAGAVGASLAMVISAFRRQLTWSVITTAVRDSAIGTSAVFIIAVGATMFTSFMALTGVPQGLTEPILSLTTDPILLIIMICVIYLILGTFLESIGIMLLTLPIVLPLLAETNVDLIWFGILAVKVVEVGLITPPVGMTCFVISAILRGTVSLSTVFRGAMWFILADVVTIALMIYFPQITLWLPSYME